MGWECYKNLKIRKVLIFFKFEGAKWYYHKAKGGFWNYPFEIIAIKVEPYFSIDYEICRVGTLKCTK